MIGLSTQEIATLHEIFKKFEKISEVILFGSRSQGTHRKASDIDLALKGDISLDTLAKLKYTLEEETNLPYFFDIVVYDKLDNAQLIAEIDKGESLYK